MAASDEIPDRRAGRLRPSRRSRDLGRRHAGALGRRPAPRCGCSITTQGDKGTQDPDADLDALAALRVEETAKAAALLGFAGTRHLDHPDGELVDDHELRGSIVRVIREVRPEVVLCPDPTAVFFGDGYYNHRDHRVTGWATLDAVAPAAGNPHYFPEHIRRRPGRAPRAAPSTCRARSSPTAGSTSATRSSARSTRCSATPASSPDEAGDWFRDFLRERAEDAGAAAKVKLRRALPQAHLPPLTRAHRRLRDGGTSVGLVTHLGGGASGGWVLAAPLGHRPQHEHRDDADAARADDRADERADEVRRRRVCELTSAMPKPMMPPRMPASTTAAEGEEERPRDGQHRRGASSSAVVPSSLGRLSRCRFRTLRHRPMVLPMQEFATTWPIGSPAMRVLVMLPTYNEIENIQDVLERARAALPEADILVIDDGSPDGTADQAEKLGEVLGGIDVLRRAQKSGLGSAYRAGFRVGPRAWLRRHDRDGRRPLPRSRGAARPRGRGRARAPTSPSAPATCRAARSPTGSGCAGAISRGGGLYAAHHARAVGARRHRRVPRLPPPTTSRRSTSTTCGPTATASRWR